MEILILLSAVLPGILLWLYIWKKDPQKEPTSKLIMAVGLGAAACIHVVFIELIMQTVLFGLGGGPTTIIGTTVDAFFVAALPEESIKLFALWIVLHRNRYFDEHFDGIVYAVCVGLGFATVENLFYLFGEEEWVTVAISRALLAVPGHYAFAVLMGYYYSVHHFVDHSKKAAVMILLVPVVAHGIYDAFALSGAVDPYVGGVCFLLLIIFCIFMHRYAKKKINHQIAKDQQNVQPSDPPIAQQSNQQNDSWDYPQLKL